VWAAEGFRHGFRALSDYADVQYKRTGTYNNQAESGIRWNHPAIGVEWPVSTPVLSQKDRSARTLAEWLATPESDHFKYH
jgi:dTDP-4-dehydrorhamnose 3,5-epimerase